MQRYTIFFITVNASGGFSAHHQELKNCTHSIGHMSSLLAATASGNVFLNYNQQDATLYNILYYCQCFGRFLRPSSGAQKLYTQHRA